MCMLRFRDPDFERAFYSEVLALKSSNDDEGIGAGADVETVVAQDSAILHEPAERPLAEVVTAR